METHYNNRLNYCLVLLFWVSISFSQGTQNMVTIGTGTYIPLYGTDDKQPVKVTAFLLDVYPVTNQEYLAFVKDNSNYRKSKIKGLFANKTYLSEWTGDLNFGALNANAPVTNISWFAAKEYCSCQGKRLATLDEWEYVAMADEKRKDARSREEFNKYILIIINHLKMIFQLQNQLQIPQEWFGNFSSQGYEKSRHHYLLFSYRRLPDSASSFCLSHPPAPLVENESHFA